MTIAVHAADPPQPHGLGPLEADAVRLARLWAPTVWAGLERAPEIATLVAGGQSQGDLRLGWLSQGYEALAMAGHRLTPEIQQGVEDRLQALRLTGFDRAIRLAEAALAFCLFRHPDRIGEGLALLHAHGQAVADARPPHERVWSDATLAPLYTTCGRFDDALRSALVAHRLAEASGVPEIAASTGRVLSVVLLSLGDLDSALAAMAPELEAIRRHGLRPPSAAYNRGLALLLQDRPQEILSDIQASPWLLDEQILAGCKPLAVLLAAAHARCGQLDQARKLLAATEVADADNEPQIAANLVWMTAEVHLACGQPARAQREIEAFLQTTEQAGVTLTPINGTQLYRLLSLAREKRRNLSGALQALKRSQEHCQRWVVQTMRARLEVLQAEVSQQLNDGPPGSGAQRHQQRLAAIEAMARQTAERRLEHALDELAHELRNPLQAMLGCTSLLMLSNLDAQQKRYVRLAEGSAQLLLQLCDGVLTIAQIEAGRFDLRPEPTDPKALLADCIGLLQPMLEASQRPVRLEQRLASTLPAVLPLDALRVRQVVLNLLGNALKFTTRGSVVLAAEWRLPDAQDPAPQQQPRQQSRPSAVLRVEVRDTGPGLSAAQQALLFREFSRLEGAERSPGAGLGLALCRRLVQAMGGRIGVESEPGRGSCFWFELPAAASDRALLH